MDFVLGFFYFALDALAILLLLATWQHTRITGFLVLAASYGLGILARWGFPMLYRFFDTGEFEAQVIGHVWQVGYLLIAGVGLAGFWDIYRKLKLQRGAEPPAT